MIERITLNAHPSNLDANARLVSGPRERLSIFSVSGGYVAADEKGALPGLHQSEAAARAALHRDHAAEAIGYWHSVCRRYDAGNAAGADMSLARKDAIRALQKAEAAGADCSELRAQNRLND
ncbi:MULTISPECIES: hypothetical protein [Bradyrhizobium]|jgi:hypothetical protein|uniref:hypothetical protein n=1 Tax=Bradyrhizobium TaxID=374 RepID=UPI0004B09C96|nr:MULTISPECIES: hypothetical protein [Bradyrhizobium]MBR1030081.1 hypothetical protein [Bradyrhizobium liaoningense]